MKGYLAIFKIRMRILLQYRAAAFAGVFTQLFWGMIFVMILRAFYTQVSDSIPLSLNQAITFVWLGQALLQLLPWSIDKEVEWQVKNGHVAYELIRPLHLYTLWFVKSLAMRLIPTAMRSFPIFAVGGWLLGLTAPISWEASVFFCLSVILAFFLSSAITTLVIISLFWTLSGEGVQRLLPHFAILFSGMIVPLPLFPNWMQTFLNIQPFRGIIDIPCRLYTGVIPSSDAFYYLGFQLGWAAILIAWGQLLMKKALKQFVIQGG